jgi:1,4-dihydroxy-2-naphthoate octaprenyltransferase
VQAHLVKRAALISFGMALGAGAVIILLSGLWWFALIGVLAVAAAWLYTGGPRPYGYAGLGELVVFVFFGPVATVGTAAIMIGEIPFEAWLSGSAAGFFASAVLMVNNIRDREQDQRAGKNTLAVRVGRKLAIVILIAFLVMPYLILAALSLLIPITEVPAAANSATTLLGSAPARAGWLRLASTPSKPLWCAW